MNSLYWHDYETWGAVPAKDRPVQFAGVRTDEELNIIGEPLMIFSRPSADLLPQPEACMITGISPQRAMAEGVSEPEFIARIQRELAQPGTCGVGYNSLRFDDEVTRYTLYRNFFDPYEREWKNGNSRWDLIDVVRLLYALRPDGINWPSHDDGSPSFKLEHLSKANNLAHDAAHDALSDVYATIALAKLIRAQQPRLYDYAYGLRRKDEVQKLFDWVQRKPLFHVSSMFPAAQGCGALVMPLAPHPVNKNAVIVYNLGVDPAPLLTLDAEEIRRRMYTASADLPEGQERIALKLVHINKSPMLVAANALTDPIAQRLQIDKAACERHWQQLKSVDLSAKLREVFAEREFDLSSDPEQLLYSGFIPNSDRAQMSKVQSGAPELLSSLVFEDPRLNAMLLLYRARHFPECLSDEEQLWWEEHCYLRLTDPDAGASIVLDEYFEQLEALSARDDLTPAQQLLLRDLFSYGESLC